MYITIEISYYPLVADYNQPVEELLAILKNQADISVEIGSMSTQIGGKYDQVMELITTSMKELMEKYPSVFNLKIANACKI